MLALSFFILEQLYYLESQPVASSRLQRIELQHALKSCGPNQGGTLIC